MELSYAFKDVLGTLGVSLAQTYDFPLRADRLLALKLLKQLSPKYTRQEGPKFKIRLCELLEDTLVTHEDFVEVLELACPCLQFAEQRGYSWPDVPMLSDSVRRALMTDWELAGKARLKKTLAPDKLAVLEKLQNGLSREDSRRSTILFWGRLRRWSAMNPKMAQEYIPIIRVNTPSGVSELVQVA